MARKPRGPTAPGIYHVVARGTGPSAIYLDDHDRLVSVAGLERMLGLQAWTCGALCLLDTHYHLLLHVTRGELGDGMRRLNGCYAQTFNRRHARSGHLFQGRYLALNPVRAGLCPAPADWPWSSYGGTVGIRAPIPVCTPRELLALFGAGEAAVRRLRAFVEDESRDGPVSASPPGRPPAPARPPSRGPRSPTRSGA